MDQGLLGQRHQRQLSHHRWRSCARTGRDLLLDISAALSTTNTFVLGINSRSTEDEFAIFRLEIRVKDSAQLQSVMNKLNQISGVLKVNRPAG